jgi:hypothetical protein
MSHLSRRNEVKMEAVRGSALTIRLCDYRHPFGGLRRSASITVYHFSPTD